MEGTYDMKKDEYNELSVITMAMAIRHTHRLLLMQECEEKGSTCSYSGQRATAYGRR